jgi:hypothetical protein
MLLVQHSEEYNGLSLIKEVPGHQILGYDNFWRLPDDFNSILPYGVQLAPETIDHHVRLIVLLKSLMITCFMILMNAKRDNFDISVLIGTMCLRIQSCTAL